MCDSTHVPVAVVVISLTLTHCHGLDLGYTSVADCRYRLIRGSLIIARFSDVGMGVGLYAGRFIREYIRVAHHSSDHSAIAERLVCCYC